MDYLLRNETSFTSILSIISNRQIDVLKNKDKDTYILNNYSDNFEILKSAMNSKKMLDFIIEKNFDINGLQFETLIPGTFLNFYTSDSDKYFKEIEVMRKYGAKTARELNITDDMINEYEERIL
jgi:hypothetical protein